MKRSKLAEFLDRQWLAVRDFLYGLTGYEFTRHLLAMRRETQLVFLLTMMGDSVGIPIMPPVYSLKLLPYVIPEIVDWKQQLARRKEFWEKDEYDLRGV